MPLRRVACELHARTMFDATKVDLVTVTPQSDAVLLYIVASEEWTGNDEQLRSLQEKIHNYVGYAVDGQMQRDHPETAGLPWRIVIDSQAGPPTPGVPR
jgi:hypothetical protein